MGTKLGPPDALYLGRDITITTTNNLNINKSFAALLTALPRGLIGANKRSTHLLQYQSQTDCATPIIAVSSIANDKATKDLLFLSIGYLIYLF